MMMKNKDIKTLTVNLFNLSKLSEVSMRLNARIITDDAADINILAGLPNKTSTGNVFLNVSYNLKTNKFSPFNISFKAHENRESFHVLEVGQFDTFEQWSDSYTAAGGQSRINIELSELRVMYSIANHINKYISIPLITQVLQEPWASNAEVTA
jgi:hypothetical protein